MKLVFTKELPDKEGYYWWTNFGEHTPTILKVEKSGKELYASNGEYSFIIKPSDPQEELDFDEDDWKEEDGKDTYRYGDQLWCYIPNPWLPNLTEQIEPDYY